MKSLLVFLLFSLLAFAQEERDLIPSSPEEIATLFSDESSLIGGVVSPLSGQLSLHVTDFEVKGAQSIPLTRIYVPPPISPPHNFHNLTKHSYDKFSFLEHLYPNCRGKGWVFLPSVLLQSLGFGKMRITEPNGSVLDFSPSVTGYILVTPAYGMSNLSQDKPSGKNDPRNTRVVVVGKEIHVSIPDGTTRIYQPFGFYYHLDREVFPSGKTAYYSYAGHNPNSIVIKNAKEQVYSYLQIDRQSSSRGSNIKSFNVRLDYLSGINFSSSSSLTARYQYEFRGEHILYKPDSRTKREEFPHCSVLGSTSSPFHRSEGFDYNRFLQLVNYFGRYHDFQVTYDEKYLPHRIYTLSLPVGEGDAFYPIYTISYDPPIAGKKAGLTVVKREDGSEIQYRFTKELLPESIQFKSSDGERKKEKIYHWYDNHWLKDLEWKDGDGNLFHRRSYEDYDSFGNPKIEKFSGDLSGEEGLEGYVIKREYSQDNRNLLLREENEEGKITTYEYLDGTNLPLAKYVLKDKEILLREFWTYDDFTNLKEKVIDDGNSKDRESLDQVTQRTITGYQLRQEQPFLHMPESIEEIFWDGEKKQQLKKTLLFYDKWGNVEKEEVEDADGKFAYKIVREYDEQGNLLSETNPLGLKARATYTPKGQIKTSKNFSNRLEKQRKYDRKGRLKKLEEIDLEKKVKHETAFEYTKLDRCRKKTDYLSCSTSYDHDPISGEVTSTTGPDILSVDHQAQSVNSSSTFDGLGRKLTHTDANGRKTKYKYNAYNSLTEIIYPNGATETFRYYRNGKLKSHTDRDGLTIEHVYDIFDRVTKKSYSVKGKFIADETYVYGIFQLKTYTDKEGHITEYSYDGAGRKISEKTSGRTTTFSYDRLGRLEAITRENTVCTHYTKDLLDQVIEEQKRDANGKVLYKIGYGWDPDGNQIAITRYPHDQPATEKFTHDPFGRLIEQRDALGFATKIVYDEARKNALGQRVLTVISTDPNGIITTKSQDPYGRNAHLEIGTSYAEDRVYDRMGNLLQIKEDSRLTRYTYDNQDLVETLTRAYGSLDARTTRYTYSAGGRLDTKTVPDGTILTYTFTPLGHPLTLTSSDGSIRQTFKYSLNGDLLNATDGNHTIEREVDDFGNILKETVDQLSFTKTYDKLNRLEMLTLPDGSSVRYAYDPIHVKTVTRISADKKTLSTNSYEAYDLAGNLLTEQLINNLGTINHTYNANGTQASIQSPFFSQSLEYDPGSRIKSISSDGSYDYNELSELTLEQLKDGSMTYDYDRHQNRKQKNELFTDHNLLDELVSAKYDLNGNLKQNGGFQYDYDALNRLTQATDDKDHLEFVYDAIGRRLSKIVNGTQELYLYHGTEELGSFEINGTPKDLKIPGIYRQPIAIELQGQTFASILDYRGNVRCLIDSKGQVSATHNYTAFGEELTPITSPFNPWRYSAKRLDQELGLYNFGKRVYDPILARWITTDPAGFIDGINLYAYLSNDPLSSFDPDGRFALALTLGGLSWGGTGGAVVGGALLSTPIGWVIGAAVIAATIYTTDKLVSTGQISSSTGNIISSTIGGVATNTMINSMSFGDFYTGDLTPCMGGQCMGQLLYGNTTYNRMFKQGSVDPDLPANPDELLKRPGWKETTHPEAGKKGHRTFENEKTGEKLRHDKGKPWETGHKAHDHYHRPNPNGIGKHDEYLDGQGKPTRDQSDPSHIYSPEGVWWNP